MLPLLLALSASLVLHVAVLLAPGWELPPDNVDAAAPLAATLALPARQPATARQGALPTKTAASPKASPPPAVPATNTPTERVHGMPPVQAEPPPDPLAGAAPDVSAVPSAPVFAEHWPRSGRLVYAVMRGADGFVFGRNETRWEHDGQHYHLRSETTTTGLAALLRATGLVLESRGRFDDFGLQPLEFVGERTGKAAERVRFEPEEGRIHLSNGTSVPYVAGAQDLLSLSFHLSVLAFEPPQLELTVAVGRRLITYAVEIGAAEQLVSPLGTHTVRRLVLTGEQREDGMELWVDVLTGMPLKIRHRDRKGETFDQVASVIELEKTE